MTVFIVCASAQIRHDMNCYSFSSKAAFSCPSTCLKIRTDARESNGLQSLHCSAVGDRLDGRWRDSVQLVQRYQVIQPLTFPRQNANELEFDSAFPRSEPLTPAQVGARTWGGGWPALPRCSIGNHTVLSEKSASRAELGTW